MGDLALGVSSDLDEVRFLFPSGLSVFFPAFNDAPSLPGLLERTFAVLRAHVADYEVIVVNDGSADSTGAVLEELKAKYAPYLRVVTHEQNQGYGAALRSGFEHATKEYVFYTDGDGQYDPSEIVNLLKAATPDCGLVNGYKTERNDPWHRVAIGWLYNQFARTLFRIRLRDIDCDFRLIRRSLLDGSPLRSTSGTICVELVSRIEASGTKVVEVPVSHYARQHGRSQFFRFRSLGTTFVQLCALYIRLVLLGGAADRKRLGVAVGSVIAALALLAYLPFLGLPFISDDYLQIALARQYGPSHSWAALLQDPLYRCRATSLILTYWTERLFGLSPVAFNWSSLVLHVVNSLLVFALGSWRVVSWRASAVAACFFAISQQHQEAVVWYSAIPELLVFMFAILSFLAWLRWLREERSWTPYLMAFVLYIAALFSKESAVALTPLLFFASWIERQPLKRTLAALAPFVGAAAVYFGLAYAARSNHLHFNDGTFSLSAPFIWTILRSSGRLLWFWGVAGLAGIAVWRAWRWRTIIGIAAVWIPVTLFPYSFLTYNPFVPSRHTYWASVGAALIVAAAFLEMLRRLSRRSIVLLVALCICGEEAWYLWTKKHRQFQARAEPTETLVRMISETDEPIVVKCFPFNRDTANLAVLIRTGKVQTERLIFDKTPETPGVDFCADENGKVRF
mgnify:CR=1 FL=1